MCKKMAFLLAGLAAGAILLFTPDAVLAQQVAPLAEEDDCTVKCGCDSFGCGCQSSGGNGKSCSASGDGCYVQKCGNSAVILAYALDGSATDVAAQFADATGDHRTVPGIAQGDWMAAEDGTIVERHPCSGAVVGQFYGQSQAQMLRHASSQVTL